MKLRPNPWFDIYINQNHDKCVAIIGGGISGASTAYSLANRGYNVIIFEKNSQLGMEASGNPQGILYNNFFGNHAPTLELSLIGYKYSHNLINQLLTKQLDFDNCGVIQLAYNNKIKSQQEKLLNGNYPHDILQFVNHNEINEILGINLHTKHNGIYFKNGLWVSPTIFINKLTNHPNIEIKRNTEIIKLISLNKFKWQLIDNHNVTYEFSNIVICNSFYATKFAQLNNLHLRKIRGQISIIKRPNNLKAILCTNGYITPHNASHEYIIGATFKFKNCDDVVNAEEHIENLNNFKDTLPNLINDIDINKIVGRVSFRSSSTDYMPLVGPIANYNSFMSLYCDLKKDANYWIDEPCPYLYGIYLNLAHGSKGLATAPISGEIIANHIDNSKLNISDKLRFALHPNRFLVKELVNP